MLTPVITFIPAKSALAWHVTFAHAVGRQRTCDCTLQFFGLELLANFAIPALLSIQNLSIYTVYKYCHHRMAYHGLQRPPGPHFCSRAIIGHFSTIYGHGLPNNANLIIISYAWLVSLVWWHLHHDPASLGGWPYPEWDFWPSFTFIWSVIIHASMPSWPAWPDQNLN